MKRLHLIIICLFCTLATTVRAQYYSVNVDTKTIAAMATAFNTEAATEAYYDAQVQEILKHYRAAEVATAGIFAGKFLERKALTNLGIWTSSTENYYYRRIYNMVSRKIMPKIWTVGGMMLKSPHNALYWGSYLMKICDETKSLCMQFESVVTNGSLSFKDIAFLEFAPNVKQLFDLTRLGNVDWQLMLDDLAKVSGNFTKENLEADLSNLYQVGLGLASSGASNIGDMLLQQNNFHDLFNGKVSKVMDIYNNYNGLIEQWDNISGKALLQMTGTDINKLFNVGNYNLTAWMTDYLNETKGQYYTQRWYIYRRDYGSETLCNYQPPTDDWNILNGSHWYRIETSDPNFYPNANQRESILQNSESHAGWTRTRVNQLNNSNDGNTYSMSYWMSAYIISKGSKQTKKAYAYEITVTKSWDRREVVYEDVFDSYSMDLNTFKGQLNARLSELNDNEEGYTYYIGSDAKRYYQATDEGKMKGVETVTISVTCNDGVQLASGNTQYKCNKCGKSLDAHTKQRVMMTSLSGNDNELDLSELESQLKEAEDKVTQLQADIKNTENEIKRLETLINNWGPNVANNNGWYQQLDGYKRNLPNLKSELNTWQQKLNDLKQAKDEAGNDNSVQTDDWYRIPAIINDCKNAYNLTWTDAGSWSGWSYIRHAKMPNMNAIITFKADVSMVRKPSYFLGIKIHRAIIKISWELTSDYTETHVEDVLQLDPNMSDEEKAKIVNKRVSEIAQQYPDCKIDVEYAQTNPAQKDDTGDVIHLLWSSDRLEVAREIDTRITKIYADLVSLEKMMHYKRNIIDVLKDVLPELDYDQGKRLTLIEECHKRWMDNAKKKKHNGPWTLDPNYWNNTNINLRPNGPIRPVDVRRADR